MFINVGIVLHKVCDDIMNVFVQDFVDVLKYAWLVLV